jgi:hypothetical protein
MYGLRDHSHRQVGRDAAGSHEQPDEFAVSVAERGSMNRSARGKCLAALALLVGEVAKAVGGDMRKQGLLPR